MKNVSKQVVNLKKVIRENSQLSNAKIKNLVETLLPLAQEYHHLSEKYCDDPGYNDDDEKREAAIEKQVQKLFEDTKIKVHFNGDPRGFAIKLVLPDGRSNDLGRETWGVPQDD